MGRTVTVITHRGAAKAPTASEAIRLAQALPREARWDGHRVVEALREAHTIRVTFACGLVGSIPVPLPRDHDARAAGHIVCRGCEAA